MQEDPVISVEGVSHFFHKAGHSTEVLHDISFAVSKGEFVSVIGTSGSGKSTLLYMMAGFLNPTAGSVKHHGEIITKPNPDRGIVFQSDAVFPWMSVQHNVEFGPRMKGISKSERRRIAQDYLARVGLTGSEKLLPRQLSGGMRKRVDVARTFANRPEVLLMDESFGALDVQTKERLQTELLQLWEAERTTAIFVTHDIEESILLADRVVILRGSPGTVVGEITVPFPRPRTADIKRTPEFQQLRRDLTDLLAGSD